MEIPKISLCIPTYNRFDKFLSINIPKYLENPYIDEIVISDEDGNDIEKIKTHFPNENKLKLFKNDSRLGPFLNKDAAVSYASNEWVCLMDSDNFAPIPYFDAWVAFIKANGIDKKNVYLPIRTIPQPNHGGFNYTEFQNIVLEKSNVKNNNIERMGCMLNTGNYIFHRDNFLETKSIMPELHSKLDVQDVFFKNALLLINNSKLMVVPNMMYDHIVHDGSFFTNNVSNFNNAYNRILSIYYSM
jgi:glycosyltransferase involved in cell wall biosynthesis